MKRTIILSLIVLVFICPLMAKGKKGHLSLKAKVSLYDPPDGSQTTIYGMTADYRFSNFLSAAGNVEYAVYDNDGGDDVKYMPVTVDGKLHALGDSSIDPYLGAGFGLFLKTVGDENETTFGFEFLGGISYHMENGFGFSGEAKYAIPDVSNPDDGGLTIGGGIEGSLEMDL